MIKIVQFKGASGSSADLMSETLLANQISFFFFFDSFAITFVFFYLKNVKTKFNNVTICDAIKQNESGVEHIYIVSFLLEYIGHCQWFL